MPHFASSVYFHAWNINFSYSIKLLKIKIEDKIPMNLELVLLDSSFQKCNFYFHKNEPLEVAFSGKEVIFEIVQVPGVIQTTFPKSEVTQN